MKHHSIRDLIAWIKEELGREVKTLQELEPGGHYCLLAKKLCPKTVLRLGEAQLHPYPFFRVKENYRMLRRALQIMKVFKEIPVQDLINGKGHYDFLRWFYTFYHLKKNRLPYNLWGLPPRKSDACLLTRRHTSIEASSFAPKASLNCTFVMVSSRAPKEPFTQTSQSTPNAIFLITRSQSLMSFENMEKLVGAVPNNVETLPTDQDKLVPSSSSNGLETDQAKNRSKTSEAPTSRDQDKSALLSSKPHDISSNSIASFSKTATRSSAMLDLPINNIAKFPPQTPIEQANSAETIYSAIDEKTAALPSISATSNQRYHEKDLERIYPRLEAEPGLINLKECKVVPLPPETYTENELSYRTFEVKCEVDFMRNAVEAMKMILRRSNENPTKALSSLKCFVREYAAYDDLLI